MTSKPLLIRFYDKTLTKTLRGNFLLNAKNLEYFFTFVDIDVYNLFLIGVSYLESMLYPHFDLFRKTTKLQIIVLCHSRIINNIMTITLEDKQLPITAFMSMLISFKLPLEILSLCCTCDMAKYVNSLPKESCIISLNYNRLVFSDDLSNKQYINQDFLQFLFKDGMDFKKIIALYYFNNYGNTDNLTKICYNSSNSRNFDMINALNVKDIKIDSPFILDLIKFHIISPFILKGLNSYINHHNPNYIFLYSYNQLKQDIKDGTFYNNMHTFRSHFISPIDNSINSSMLEKFDLFYAENKIDFYINPFRLLNCDLNNEYFMNTSYLTYVKAVIILNHTQYISTWP
jgi:hypothetical protein